MQSHTVICDWNKSTGEKQEEQGWAFWLEPYLMSPSFLPMAVPTVERAAEVFCPAWDSVSWVFLYL